MKDKLTFANALLDPLRKVADIAGAPAFDLAARLYVAWAFWKSGMTRWNDFINGSFDNQIFLFELEHPVPGIPADIAAYMALFGEIVLPILLVLGLFTRFAAAGLFVMALIIDLTYLHNSTHVLWMFLSAAVFIHGPKIASVDHWLVKWLRTS